MDPASMALVVGGSTLGAFGTFMPSFTDMIESHPDDPLVRKKLTWGEGMTVLWSFTIAAIVATKMRSSKPYLIWLGGSVVLIGASEYLLHRQSDPQEEE